MAQRDDVINFDAKSHASKDCAQRIHAADGVVVVPCDSPLRCSSPVRLMLRALHARFSGVTSPPNALVTPTLFVIPCQHQGDYALDPNSLQKRCSICRFARQHLLIDS